MPTHATLRRTPHITAVHPVTNEKYVCRVLSHRRGGAIRIELLPGSSDGLPGKVLVVHRTRAGYIDLVVACDGLLQASRPNPGDAHLDKSKQRVQWNPHSVDYPLRAANAQTLVAFIPRLLNPQRGRPVHSTLTEFSREMPPTGIHPTTHGARTARRGEILMATSKMLTLNNELVLRTADLRKMKGYSSVEARQIHRLSMQVDAALTQLRKAVFEGRLIDPPQPSNELDPVASPENLRPHARPVEVDMSKVFAEDEEIDL